MDNDDGDKFWKWVLIALWLILILVALDDVDKTAKLRIADLERRLGILEVWSERIYMYIPATEPCIPGIDRGCESE